MKMRSLPQSLLIVLLTTTVFCLGSYFLYDYLSIKNDYLSDLQAERERIGLQARKNLVLPIYNLDDSQALQVIESLMTDQNIEAIVVRNTFKANPITASCRRNEKGKVISASIELPLSPLRDTHEVYYDNEKLGYVDILYTMSHVNKRLATLLWTKLAACLTLVLIMCSVMFLLLRQIILVPFQKLARFATEIETCENTTAAVDSQNLPLDLHAVHHAMVQMQNQLRTPNNLNEPTQAPLSEKQEMPQQQSQPVPTKLVEESMPATEATIMIIDDEEMIVDMLRIMLRQMRYTTRTFTSSVEAVSFFSENPHAVDMIITDYAMPAMTGLELVDACLAIRKDIPIIICTGFSDHLDADIAREHGVNDLIHKPIDRAYLRTSIGELLSAQRSA